MLASRWTKLFTSVNFDIGAIAGGRGLLLNWTLLREMMNSVTTYSLRLRRGIILTGVLLWLIKVMLMLIWLGALMRMIFLRRVWRMVRSGLWRACVLIICRNHG